MSYESQMLQQLAMPTRKEVEHVLLRTLFNHGGTIKEFIAGEAIVTEIADEFKLTPAQRAAFLQTTYTKENRVKKAFLWHRLLFRAADALAKEGMLSRPSQTVQLTDRREWMLTEKGFDAALKLCNVPTEQKECLPIKSYEVQKIVKKMIDSPVQQNYDPFDTSKKVIKTTKESVLRNRAFRQAVVEAYAYSCAVCRMKLSSPDALAWEVEAAHIVPHRSLGKDDLCNGIALCHLHHWAFDVGWFGISDDFSVQISSHIKHLPSDCAKVYSFPLFQPLLDGTAKLHVPAQIPIQPHRNSLRWHRENIFHKQCLCKA